MHAEEEERANASEPVRQVLQLIRAIRDSRLPDLLAVVHPDVTCEPLLRPGLTLYHGYKDMARFTADMHAVHGRYQIEIGTITEHPGPEVVLHSTIVPEPARNLAPLPVTITFTFRDGLIITIDGEPPPSTP
jgi:hypothetical protein